MKVEVFILDDRFIVDPSRGLVTDREGGGATRIEPRLIQLLCMLADRPGELVRRETITREIWEDYGNADEGLTQAISYLRKVLQDEGKRRIETIPKKGYILHMAVGAWGRPDEAEREQTRPRRPGRKVLRVLLPILILLLLAAWLYFRNPGSSDKMRGPDVVPERGR